MPDDHLRGAETKELFSVKSLSPIGTEHQILWPEVERST